MKSRHMSLGVVFAGLSLASLTLLPGSEDPAVLVHKPVCAAATTSSAPLAESSERREIPPPASDPAQSVPRGPCSDGPLQKHIAPNATLRGWVVERGTGRALAGCTVRVASACAGCGSVQPGTAPAVLTDASGAFALPLRTGMVALHVERPGSVPTRFEPVDVRTSEVTLDAPIELEPCVAASVTLHRRRGSIGVGIATLLPIEGASEHESGGRDLRSRSQRQARVERFGPDGIVRFHGLAPGRYLASFRADGVAELRTVFAVAGGTTTLPAVLTVAEGACVRGWVRDALGAGVPGVVTIEDGRGPGQDAVTPVANDGSFELNGLREGSVTLGFRGRAGTRPAAIRIRRDLDLRDDHTLDIALEAPAVAGIARGTILGVRAATRQVALTFTRTSLAQSLEVEAEVSGDSFVAPLPEAGDYEFTLSGEEGGRTFRQRGRVLLAPGAAARVAIARASLEVRVSGSPTDRARLSLALAVAEADGFGSVVHHATDSTVPDADGIVRFDELTAGEYCVLADCDDRRPQVLGRVYVSGGDTRVALTVAAPQGY